MFLTKKKPVTVWTKGSSPVYLGKEQVAEIIVDETFGYVVKNSKANVLFSNTSLTEIRLYLNMTYPGWRKDRRIFARKGRS